MKLKSHHVKDKAYGISGAAPFGDDDRKTSFGGKNGGVVFYKPGGQIYR
jgi:hypothetical protein